MARYLFNYFPKLKNEIEKANKIIFFLDYDGTLIPFKKKPKLALPTKKLLNILKTLTKCAKSRVIIITGRGIDDIKRMLNIPELSFAGLHGLEIEFPHGKKFTWKKAKETKPLIDRIREKAYKEFKNELGVYIEDKKFTVAFHYRLLARERVDTAKKRFIDIVREVDKKKELEVMRGAEVLEARPKGWHKGKATEVILKKFGKGLNFYIGDDKTDEDAFDYLKNLGITVLVLNNSIKPTKARFYLKNPEEVLSFLKCFLKIAK